MVGSYFVIFAGTEKIGRFFLLVAPTSYLSLWLAFFITQIGGVETVEQLAEMGKSVILGFFSPRTLFSVLSHKIGLTWFSGLLALFMASYAAGEYFRAKI